MKLKLLKMNSSLGLKSIREEEMTPSLAGYGTFCTYVDYRGGDH